MDNDELEKKRWMAVGAVALWILQAVYIVSPIDFIPDFIPVIGWMDDLVALIGLGATSIWMAKTVLDADFKQLFAVQPRKLPESEPYEPIAVDVIRSM